MALPTTDPRIQRLLIDTEERDIGNYERNSKGSLVFTGNEEAQNRLQVNLLEQERDEEEIPKVVDTEISELATDNDEEIDSMTIE